MKNFQKLASLEARKKREMSQHDMRFMKILDKGTKLKAGDYQITLPFKQEDVKLPCIKYQAAQ